MKILSIGNSFSNNSTRYLSNMAKKCGIDVETYNLYIGGCSLYTHYINALEELSLYSFIFNGVDTHIKLSIKQALIANEYDVVTLQQASHYSFKPETYQPYTDFLFNYVKKYNPHAKIYVHQTWGYKEASQRLFDMEFETHAEMYSAVESAYDVMYKSNDFAGLLPSGKTISLLHEMGFSGSDTHNDNIHLSKGLGQFASSLAWLETLTGFCALDCDFSDFDAPVSDEAIIAAKQCAHDACLWAQKYKK